MQVGNYASAGWHNKGHTRISMSMQHIGGKLKFAAGKARITERGEMMRYFCEKLNRSRIQEHLPPITMGRMGKILEKIPTKDLYYLKRVCDDAKIFRRLSGGRLILRSTKRWKKRCGSRKNWRSWSRKRKSRRLDLGGDIIQL